jgi:fucose 4-O-acetylase-like acetyltransferase
MEKQKMAIHQEGRIAEIDYLKCVFILLMITFHLTYIGHQYPYLKQIVYTFHMPAFLIMSGYFVSASKPLSKEIRELGKLFASYIAMEICYTTAAAYLPVTDHISRLSPCIIMQNTLIKPLGPYWYIHTLILCSASYYLVMRKSDIHHLLLLGILFYLYSEVCHIVSFSNTCYFLAGVVLKNSGVTFLRFFKASPLSAIPIAIVSIFYPQYWNKCQAIGCMMVYFTISGLLCVYPYIHRRLRHHMQFIGRHTLCIYLLSPIFTGLAKLYQSPLIAIDGTGTLFLIVSLATAVAGSLMITAALMTAPRLISESDGVL